ncbi:MAG: DUF1080 domain-containing protein [Dehalococcoidia bacterium]|nr:DUF1080 domain-containing protein [Dehalococcoidia bacterium]
MYRNRRLAVVVSLALFAISVAAVTAVLAWPASPAEARRNPEAAAAWRKSRSQRTRTPAPTIATVVPTPTAPPAAEETAAPATPEPTATTPAATPTSATPPPASTPATVPTLGLSPAVGFADDFEALPVGVAWADSTTHGAWYSRYNGYGTVAVEQDGDRVLSLSPRAATTSGATHAALVQSTTVFGDIDFTVQVKTVTQLRTPTPNAWESGWVLWHFTDDTHFYYAALKPNGIEVGKEDPAYPGAQRFLVTLSNPSFAVGKWYTVRVKHVGTTFTIWIDGVPVTTFTDNERPYTGGAVALYTEDADVHFNNFSARQP